MRLRGDYLAIVTFGFGEMIRVAILNIDAVGGARGFAGVPIRTDQSVQRSAAATQATGEDQFVVVDATVGYRLAKRRGVLSLAVKNLFDTEFMYQDDSYREFRDEPSIGPYFPDRTVMARMVVGF